MEYKLLGATDGRKQNFKIHLFALQKKKSYFLTSLLGTQDILQ